MSEIETFLQQLDETERLAKGAWTVNDCEFCDGLGSVNFEDPVTRGPASMLCPVCTTPDDGVDLVPQLEPIEEPS